MVSTLYPDSGTMHMVFVVLFWPRFDNLTDGKLTN